MKCYSLGGLLTWYLSMQSQAQLKGTPHYLGLPGVGGGLRGQRVPSALGESRYPETSEECDLLSCPGRSGKSGLAGQ